MYKIYIFGKNVLNKYVCTLNVKYCYACLFLIKQRVSTGGGRDAECVIEICFGVDKKVRKV